MSPEFSISGLSVTIELREPQTGRTETYHVQDAYVVSQRNHSDFVVCRGENRGSRSDFPLMDGEFAGFSVWYGRRLVGRRTKPFLGFIGGRSLRSFTFHSEASGANIHGWDVAFTFSGKHSRLRSLLDAIDYRMQHSDTDWIRSPRLSIEWEDEAGNGGT